MYLDAVWRAKQGESNVLEASYAKMYSPPVVLEAVATALDILGEAGVRNDRMLEKLYRDVKILDIGEGTQQVQRVRGGPPAVRLPPRTRPHAFPGRAPFIGPAPPRRRAPPRLSVGRGVDSCRDGAPAARC